MKTIKKILGLVTLVLLMAACNKNEQIASENINSFPADGIIRVATNVETPQTRAGMATEDLNRFQLRIINEANNSYSYNAVMLKKAGQWESFESDEPEAAAITLLWQNKTQIVKVAAVSFSDTQGMYSNWDNNREISVYGNQDSSKLKEIDILYMKKKEIDPSKDLIGGKMQITLKHRLSKLNITIKMGTEFNKLVGGTTINLISDIAVRGVNTKAFWGLNQDTLVSHNDSRDIIPWNNTTAYIAGEGATNQAQAKYECILIPQTVDANNFSVKITIGNRIFVWSSPLELKLNADTQYNLTLVVGHDIVSLGGFNATPWNLVDPQDIETM